MLVAISILAIIFTALSSAGSLALIYCAFTGAIPVATVITAIISAFISTIMLFALKKALSHIDFLEQALFTRGVIKRSDIYGTTMCPKCGELLYPEYSECPRCHMPIYNDNTPINDSPATEEVAPIEEANQKEDET